LGLPWDCPGDCCIASPLPAAAGLNLPTPVRLGGEVYGGIFRKIESSNFLPDP